MQRHTNLKSLVGFSLIAFAVVFFTACPPHASVYQLTSNPARYEGREVTVTGRVTDSYGALGFGAYEIDDGTGRMWIVSRRGGGVPSRGARVGARGYVRTAFAFGGRSFGTVLEETDRRIGKY
jgi:hypothetical protein